MTWPWVRRAELDRAVDELRVQRERYDALLAVLLGSRLNTPSTTAPTFGVPETASVPVRPRTPHDPVLDAIQQKAGANVTLRRQLAMYARGRRTDAPKASATQIATEILHWRDAADVFGDAADEAEASG